MICSKTFNYVVVYQIIIERQIYNIYSFLYFFSPLNTID